MRKPTPSVLLPAKKQNSKSFQLKKIESARLSTPSEGLNSSLAHSAGELWPSAKMASEDTFCRT